VQTLPSDVQVSAAVFAADTHDSFMARSGAVQRRCQQNSSMENAAPAVKDAARLADPATVRRWFGRRDDSIPPFSLLRRVIGDFSHGLACGRIVEHGSLRLSWPTVVPFHRELSVSLHDSACS